MRSAGVNNPILCILRVHRRTHHLGELKLTRYHRRRLELLSPVIVLIDGHEVGLEDPQRLVCGALKRCLKLLRRTPSQGG
jgi:hypothetical protein